MPTCPSCQSLTGLSTLSCPSCGSNLTLDAGTLIAGRYEIFERLGRGGMGTVYRAKDRDLDQNVAIKFVPVGSHPQAVARFKSEIRLARKVNHRNVCAVWQNGYEGELAYIVMELIEGRTLRDLVKEQGPLAWGRACHLALQAAQGLEAIHEAGVIHRDVKTSNLMIDGRGVVRLVDFGIAKGDPSQPGPDLTVDPRITGSNQVVGSPEYMSPEQIQGLPLDPRTDIYSFGIVLYELFTGRVPFRGTSAFDTMMLHVKEAPLLEGPMALTIPPVVVPILKRALAKSREDRYGSMRTLSKELKRAHSLIERTKTDPDEIPVPVTWWRRPGVWAPVAGLVLGLVALYSVSPPGPPKDRSEPSLETASPQPTPAPAPVATAAAAPTPSPAPSRPPALKVNPHVPPSERGAPGARQVAVTATASPSPSSLPVPVTNELSTTPRPAPEEVVAPPKDLAPVPVATPSPSLPQRGQLYQAGEPDLVQPSCLACPPPLYPPNLERAGLQGVVPVELLVDENGRVQQPRAMGSAHKEFKAAAVETVRDWSYRPATRQGVPGKMVLVVEVSFTLPGTRRR